MKSGYAALKSRTWVCLLIPDFLTMDTCDVTLDFRKVWSSPDVE